MSLTAALRRLPVVPDFPWSRGRRTEAGAHAWHLPELETSAGWGPSAFAGAAAALLARYGHHDRIPIGLIERGDRPFRPLLVSTSTGGGREDLARSAAEGGLGACPLSDLVELRSVRGQLEGPPAFPVLAFWDLEPDEVEAPLRVAMRGSSLTVRWDGAWVDEPTGLTFGRRLASLLRLSCRDDHADLRAVRLLEPEERDLLLGPWAGRTWTGRHGSIPEAFREAARTYGTLSAVEQGDRVLSYTALSAEMEQGAAALRRAGVGPGQRVGLLLDRSIDSVVGTLSVLAAGGAYVPLDLAYPDERLRAMVARADVSLLVTSAERLGRLAGLIGSGGDAPSVLDVAALSSGGRGSWVAPALSGDDPAYVMFTSGSSGRPKGVEVPHRAVLRLVQGNDFVHLGPDVRFLGFAPAAFDAATLEIWGPLLNGGTLVLAPSTPSLMELGEFIRERAVTTAWLTSAVFREMVEYHLPALAGVRELLSGGDVLSPEHVQRVLTAYPGISLVNGYGPTENTTFTTCHRIARGERLFPSVPIGRPIVGTQVFVLDGDGELVPPGFAGELYATGEGLARGYVGGEASGDRFRDLRISSGGARRAYRTGDLVRHLSDGALEFLGRADDQVKIRGHRVEPGEVEAALRAIPGVRLAAVIAVGESGDRSLLAAVVPESGPLDASRLREELRARLPEPMIPASILVVDRLPTTPNGKVDRAALAATAAASSPEVPSDPGEEGWVERIAAVWRDLLPGPFGLDDGFFEVGGNSLLALRLVEELRVRTGAEVSPVRIFEHPTVRALADHLAHRAGAGRSTPPVAPRRAARVDVAVIGMAGRFPGAADIHALWSVLRDGRETVQRFRPEELDPAIDPVLRRDPAYVPVRGVLQPEEVEGFDHAFFGIQARAADIMDPQHRLLLEVAWEAFEDAGTVPGAGSHTGVFVGISHNTYLEHALQACPDLKESYGDLNVLLGSDKDFAATRIAHRLDLGGPAVVVQSASSSSLTAVAMAVTSIRAGQCDRALAGGASVSVPWRAGQVHQEGAMYSRDGSTRAFDAHASGTVFSDGAAMVLLKRLDLAEAEGDRILGVIRGVGVTNDGAGRASFMAPTVSGQALCISQALRDAGWKADSVSYVEAHGTGTPLGDPIEVEALSRAYRETTQRTHFCLIGSLKSNVGHLTAGAGVAGLIKVLLAMQHRFIPPTINFDAPNPMIDFDESPFVVVKTGTPWISEGDPRRAGVSSFGAGGTNVHVVVEEWPQPPAEATPTVPRLLMLSAASQGALRRAADRLAGHLVAQERESSDLTRVARTLRVGREVMPYRGAVAAPDGRTAAARLQILNAPPEPALDGPPLVFLLPGQGSQRVGMGWSLYGRYAAFRSTIDRCAEAMGDVGGHDLRAWLQGAVPGRDPAEELARTSIAQPALFAVEIALARLLASAGVQPHALVGHSLGEISAAVLSEVLSIDDAARLVAARGRLMEAAPSGSMLAVRASAEDLVELLEEDTVLSAENAPRAVTVSGPHEALTRLAGRLEQNEIQFRRLRVSHAFHSPSMADAAEAFADEVRRVHLARPRIPFTSCLTGEWITPEEAVDPLYWSRQLRHPVRFREAATRPVGGAIWVEVGPPSGLGPLVRQARSEAGLRLAFLLGGGADAETEELGAFLTGLGMAWTHGADIPDLGALDPLPDVAPVSLPTYSYDRVRHWIDATAHGNGRPVRWDELVKAQADLVERQRAILEAWRERPDVPPAKRGAENP